MISRVGATAVRVSRRKEFLPKTAHGEVAFNDYVVLSLETSTGVIGFGEVTCSRHWNGEDASTSIRLVSQTLNGALTGIDVADWRSVSAAFDFAIPSNRPFLRAAVEMACLDAVGQVLGVPVAKLLGGSPDVKIPTKIVLPARNPERVAAMASEVLASGATALKVKVGVDPEDDIARVRAVRAVAGDAVLITVDANEGWDVASAFEVIPILMDLGVRAFEQPLPRNLLKEAADLRRRTGAILVADESIWTWRDLVAILNFEAFDIVSLYPGKCGGLRRTVAMADFADSHGIGVTIGSNLELGIGTAALAHTAASVLGLTPAVPSDVIGPLYFESSLVTNDDHVSWGGAICPRGNGLGVQLDFSAIRAHIVNDS